MSPPGPLDGDSVPGDSAVFEESVSARGIEVSVEGDFNPAIFQPAWFQTFGLISAEESLGAEIVLIHPGASSWQAGGIGVEVTNQRFRVFSLPSPAEPVSGAVEQGGEARVVNVVSTVMDRLAETPVRGLTLSFHVVCRMNSSNTPSRLTGFVDDSQFGGVLPGARASSVTIDGRSEGPEGVDLLSLTVEPALDEASGLFFGYAYYRNLDSGEPTPPGAGKVLAVLGANWEKVRQDAYAAFLYAFEFSRSSGSGEGVEV
jgi:hypothetical protein